MDFQSLGLSSPLVKAAADQGYETATPIQEQAIPAVLAGRDVMAAAQTGTGKTAGFTLPILDRLAAGKHAQPNQTRALILTPTRELAAQVGASVVTYSKYLQITSTVVFGGVKINPQMMKLRRGVDVLVATPGRLLDLHSQNAVNFDRLEMLVLDEADRMLDMGFIHDIKRIILSLPKRRQNLLFSATFSEDIRTLAKGLVRDPVEISVSPRNAAAPTVTQWLCPVDKKRKPALLTHLIHQHGWKQVLVFTKTKHGANKLTKHLEAEGIVAAAIHGNKSQGARTRALAGFKAGETRVLVATDIAARGLDIEQLPQVVNFDLPNVSEDYVHRIGRTGRAGMSGEAISLVSADEVDLLSDIERLTNKLLMRVEVEDFEPDQRVPETILGRRASVAKARKPLNRESQKRDNSRSNPQKKRTSVYGQGPTPGTKRKKSLAGHSSESPAGNSASDKNSRVKPKADGAAAGQNSRGNNASGNQTITQKRTINTPGNHSQYRRRDA